MKTPEQILEWVNMMLDHNKEQERLNINKYNISQGHGYIIMILEELKRFVTEDGGEE